ncbi:MAG: helix-turn-helix domain-containing protein [Gracilimonas sp.]|uniref:hypothetical protein n=1 Tax=Gracilimonas sp. TaxID=1974203 RepID=UPI00199E43D1|nr:hypothetical protein [Gracilimonas sp.]MBD3615850.1 helix-turn-helix domain-containing protein [Gracilimonas sp.]
MNDLVVTPLGELEDRIRQIVREEFRSEAPAIVKQANRKDYLTTAEFKELTGMCYRTQKYHRDAENIEYVQDGRRILYPIKAVDQFLEERRVKAAG